MSEFRLLAMIAAGAALSPAAEAAEQRRVLSVTAEVISSCTVTTTRRGLASAACDDGRVVSVSRRGQGDAGPGAGKAAGQAAGARGRKIDVVTLTF